MSQGLPLVITPNTGGDDLVIEGRTGFLVPIRSPEKIAEKLAWFNQHRQELLAMKEQAIAARRRLYVEALQRHRDRRDPELA